MKGKILNRVKPCPCGCQGRDPWHARRFTRELRDVTEVSGQTRVTAFKEPAPFRRRARATLPWGEVTVVEVIVSETNPYVLGWCIAPDLGGDS